MSIKTTTQVLIAGEISFAFLCFFGVFTLFVFYVFYVFCIFWSFAFYSILLFVLIDGAQVFFIFVLFVLFTFFTFFLFGNGCGRSRSTCMQNFGLLARKLSELCSIQFSAPCRCRPMPVTNLPVELCASRQLIIDNSQVYSSVFPYYFIIQNIS